MGATIEQYTRILLTEDEMTRLDDGQAWYAAGDTVYLGGYLTDDAGVTNGALDLNVNGEVHDNWTALRDLDAALQAKLVAFAGTDRQPCPMCSGAGYIVSGPEAWNNDFCPVCEGSRFAPTTAEVA